ASTGTDGQGALLAGSAVLMLGGAALYRRFRPRPVR
ncbi:LPXTG cell wall anchor domain-containing protein, partial [Streptomyces sp. S6]